ncbi:MAG: hypothetical protein H6718_11775 [Polyangiaceae bacterium]|nr:hypothetical protein [Polyangiaceae bacterium]MCB9608913.1 hypothetical protein [Polyangiaceae bacterium]
MTTGRITSTLSCLFTLLTVGCVKHTSTMVDPSELPEVARERARGFVRTSFVRTVAIADPDDTEVRLTLRVCRDARGEYACHETVELPLSELTANPEDLGRGVRVTDVEHATIETDLPPEPRYPNFSVGLTVGGPGFPLAPNTQWYPADRWALELSGIVPAPCGFVGVRHRPGTPSWFRPWVGVALGSSCLDDSSRFDPHAALRVGVDLRPEGDVFQLTPELDALILPDIDAGWIAGVLPWAGLTWSHLF